MGMQQQFVPESVATDQEEGGGVKRGAELSKVAFKSIYDPQDLR